MEQQYPPRRPAAYTDPNLPQDGPDLGRAFAGQGSATYGGDLGISFEQHNSSPELWVEHRKSHVWVWVVVLLACLLAAFLVYRLTGTKTGAPAAGAGAGAGRGRGQNMTPAITVGQSETGDINLYDNALGTVTPLNTVTLYSQITGKVMSVHYREGQLVRKGDPLVDIDPRPNQASLAQAKGSLQHDQGVLAQARVDLARYQAAYARNAIAKQQLDDQEQAVIQDEGSVQADQGAVQAAEVQLSYTHIVAPISGRVGLRLVDPGNTVFSGSSSTLVVITQLQPITVVFNVSEDDLPAVQTELNGHKTLQVDAFDRANDKVIEAGKLTSLDNQIDTTTGTIKFRATFPNHASELFPNQFVNARLLVRTLRNTVLVPSAAIQHNGTSAFVYLVNQGPPKNHGKSQPAASGAAAANGQPSPAGSAPPAPDSHVNVQNVTVVTSNERQTAVTGLPAGVTVATSGFDRLEEDAAVSISKSAPGQKKGQSDAAKPTSGNTAP